jgi:hypothetical protein
MAPGARGGIQPVSAIENLMATTERYENARGVQALD